MAAVTEPGQAAPALVWDHGTLLEASPSGNLVPSTVQLPVGATPAALALRGQTMLVAPYAGGILRKTPRGWDNVLEGLPPSTLVPRRSTVIAALAILPASSDEVVGVSEVMQVLTSADGGRTWNADVAGIGTPESRALGQPHLAVAGPALPSTLYCARARLAAGARTEWQVFRSDDAGRSWRRIGKNQSIPGAVLGLEVNAADPQSLLVHAEGGDLAVDAR